MVELRCPSCRTSHWEIDHGYRGAHLLGQKELSYSERMYFCPHCQVTLSGYAVLQKSPPKFFLQPHPLYPMNRNEFDYWITVLRQYFPDYPNLSDLDKTWRPNGGKGWLRPENVHRGHRETAMEQTLA